MTVIEVIQRGAEYLARKGVESPRLQVELLLAHTLGVPRLRLYLDFERNLAEGEVEAVRELVRRRGHREPLQYLVGSACFCGIELAVNRHVLVPRPETELLAERAWQHLDRLAAASSGASPALSVLDFGTGSGCLAIFLALRCPTVAVSAVDLSDAALQTARANAARHGVADRIRFLQGDGFSAVPAGTRFTLVVANPPYVPSPDIPCLEPEVRDHDPHLALDGGPDGLAFMRRLAAECPAFLVADGQAMIEFGDGQAEGVAALFDAAGWTACQVVTDYQGRARLLVASRPALSRAP